MYTITASERVSTVIQNYPEQIVYLFYIIYVYNSEILRKNVEVC